MAKTNFRLLPNNILCTVLILAKGDKLCTNNLTGVSVDRMPVILGDKGATDTWLNGSSSSKFETLLKPYEDSDLVRAF